MRHRNRGRHLNRNAGPPAEPVPQPLAGTITHESIVTTLPKAKELRPFVEKLITLAKKADAVDRRHGRGKDEAEVRRPAVQALHYRRQAMALLGPTHGTGI